MFFGQKIVRGEIKAPIHVPCRMKEYPGLKDIQEWLKAQPHLDFKIRPFVQPPQLLWFDATGRIASSEDLTSDFTLQTLQKKVQEFELLSYRKDEL